MSAERPLHALAAHELAALLETGAVTSVEVVAALWARADESEPKIRGYARRRREESLAEARESDAARRRGDPCGPLHGLPITVKDNIDVRGLPTTAGLLADETRIAERDAPIVAAARRAGAIVLGKSNVPQALLSMHGWNAIHGATTNPWSAAHVTGGSSSGEGALLASGASVLGLGTDLGGSVRFPAAFCGVAGLKPTQDRWSNRGVLGAIPGQELVRPQVGPMARTVRDLEPALEALPAGAQSADDRRVPPIDDAPAPPLRGRRVGWFLDDGVTAPNPALRRAVEDSVRWLIEDEGMIAVPYAPALHRELVALYLAATSADGLATLEARFGDERPARSLRWIWTLGRLPRPLAALAPATLRALGEPDLAFVADATGRKPVSALWRLAARRAPSLAAEVDDAWAASDLVALVCPAGATPAVPIGMEHDASLAFSHFGVWNVLGMPAGVVPVSRVRPDEIVVGPAGRGRVARRLAAVARESAGLPVAVQVVVPRWHDRSALAVMAAIERAALRRGATPQLPVTA